MAPANRKSLRDASDAPTASGRASLPRSRQQATPFTANDAANPYLPSIDTHQSFSYGSTNTPVLPRQLGVNAFANVDDVAATLDADIRAPITESAGFRQIEEEARNSPEKQRVTRGQRRAGSVFSSRDSVSPSRAARRESTPEIQPMGSLREASGEPDERFDQLADAIERSSISWDTERHLLASEQQPHPFRSQPQAQGAGRISLGWPRSRPTHQQQAAMSPSPRPSTSSISAGWPQPGPAPAARFSPQPMLGSAARISPHSQRAPVGILQPAFTQPPVRGIRPTAASAPLREDASSDNEQQPHTPKSEHTPATSRPSTPALDVDTATFTTFFQHFRLPSGIHFGGYSHLITVLLTLMVAFCAYVVRDDIRTITKSIHLPFSKCTGPCVAPMHSNYTDSLDRMLTAVDTRLTTVEDDLVSIKQDLDSRPAVPVDPLEPRRPNYFSLGMGALVDPYLTSPTRLSTGTLAERFRRYAAGIRPGPAPIAALTPWDEVGDCWCAATTNGKAQLAVLLGRPIIPDEVIIEHLPSQATLDPGSAPQSMELWAEYKLYPRVVRSGGSEATSEPPADTGPTGDGLLRSSLLSSMEGAFPGDPPAAYSNDDALGPAFFRVGTWMYDIHATHHIQRFKLGVVVNVPGAGVERVVVRATSNWGGRFNTCFYRVRLHGQAL